MNTKILKRTGTSIKWTARILGILLFLFVLVFLIGEGSVIGALKSSLLMKIFFIVMIGYLLAWKWELIGGLISLIGMFTFYLCEYFSSGHFPKGWAFLIFYIPGILFLISWGIDKFVKTSSEDFSPNKGE